MPDVIDETQPGYDGLARWRKRVRRVTLDYPGVIGFVAVPDDWPGKASWRRELVKVVDERAFGKGRSVGSGTTVAAIEAKVEELLRGDPPRDHVTQEDAADALGLADAKSIRDAFDREHDKRPWRRAVAAIRRRVMEEGTGE